jgi:hypothetical protein
MPYSNVEQITPIMQEVLRIKPCRMLDVGCGLGIYGLLSRVQLDLYSDEEFYKKLFRKHRASDTWAGARIDAIEGFEDYLDYIPKWVYNQITVEDVRTALPKIQDNQYDLCLALAIIEHLSKEEGLEFIRHLRRIGHAVIIAVPKQVGPQEVPDNPFETHRSHWHKEEFIALGANRFLPHSGAWIAVFDPSLPAYSTAEEQSPPSGRVADLSQLEAKLDALLRGQAEIRGALSVKHRLKTYWNWLTRK